nr:MauE/DoxX family redox-associated membrane protein [Poritiphilus flavus]
MPAYLPKPELLVWLSGIAEILLGLGLCFSGTRNISVYGIVLMLVVFLLVHIHMLRDKKASMGLPVWLLIARIPLQFGLMYWALNYLI